MNEKISDLIARHISHLPFLSKVAGCVQELKYKQKGVAKEIKIPIASVVYTSSTDFSGRLNLDESAVIEPKYCEVSEQNKDLVPNSKETGIAYFEDGGYKRIDGNKRTNVFEGDLTLVVWLNMKKIGDYSITEICKSLLSQLPSQLNDETFQSAKITIEAVKPKRPSPFEKYTYNEAEKQYLNFPFDYFAVKIKHVVRVSKNCSSNIILNPQEC